MSFFKKSSSALADRFLKLFAWYNIPTAQIPRLIPQLRYQDLQNPKSLLVALTPSIIDHAAQLFGIRSQWLEGTDDLVFFPFGSKGTPTTILAQLARAEIAAASDGNTWHRVPLCVLTTTKKLDSKSSDQQWLVPVIVEPTGATAEGPVYRCHVFASYYDWTLPRDRLELKAITWLARHHLRRVVPLYQVSEDDLLNFVSGMAVPSMVFNKPLSTSPSLEDFIETREESHVAKETDELPQVLAYLDASGLKARWHEVFTLPSKTDAPAPAKPEATGDAPPATPEKPAPRTPAASGKRKTQQASWDAILAAAQAIWADQRLMKQPLSTYADMIERLKTMPHLRTPGESAIHKKLRDIAPPEVRGKPGRKPK